MVSQNIPHWLLQHQLNEIVRHFGTAVIAIRLGGVTPDENVVIKLGDGVISWRVTIDGIRHVSPIKIVDAIREAAQIERLPQDVEKVVYDNLLRSSGWIVIHVINSRIIEGNHTPKLDS